MLGVYGAAIVVAVFGLAGAAALWWAGGRRWTSLLPVLIALPLSPAVNYLIKRPLLNWFSHLTGVSPRIAPDTPWWFLLAIHFLPPLTEEAAKLAPLFATTVRRQLGPGGPLVRLALATGLGFGLGEAWWIAQGVAASGQYGGLPFYQFGGFINERLLVLFVHGALTAVALRGVARSARRGPGSVASGYAQAALLHALVNVGAVLYKLGIIGPVASYFLLIAAAVFLGWVVERIYREGLRDAPRTADIVWQAAERGKE